MKLCSVFLQFARGDMAYCLWREPNRPYYLRREASGTSADNSRFLVVPFECSVSNQFCCVYVCSLCYFRGGIFIATRVFLRNPFFSNPVFYTLLFFFKRDFSGGFALAANPQVPATEGGGGGGTAV